MMKSSKGFIHQTTLRSTPKRVRVRVCVDGARTSVHARFRAHRASYCTSLRVCPCRYHPITTNACNVGGMCWIGQSFRRLRLTQGGRFSSLTKACIVQRGTKKNKAMPARCHQYRMYIFGEQNGGKTSVDHIFAKKSEGAHLI